MKFKQGDKVIVDRHGGVNGLVLREYLTDTYEVRIFRADGSTNGETVCGKGEMTLDTDSK